MRKIRSCGRLLLVAIFVTPGATLLCAQNVPPPPKPAPDGPSLVETLESLKQTLLSSAVPAVIKTYPPDTTFPPISKGIRIVGVKNDPDNCRLGIDGSQVVNDTPPKPWGVAYDLETIDTAEVMTLQEGQDLLVTHGLDGPAKLSDGYVIVIDDMPWPFPLSFSNKDTAIRAAQLFRRAGEICRARPVRLNATGGPSLSETLLFIQQKLNEEASVVYEIQPQHGNSSRVSSRVANAEAQPTSCQIRYKDFEITYDMQGNPRTPREYNFHLLFRYVRKLEVVDEQTFAARLGGPIISAVTPNVYCLVVTGDDEYDFYFRDAEMADRVAKAMNHAAELCGSSKTKEPF
ncbi:MAG TPA: hypothetical protein VK813_09480 [Edaphobacter sp.]|jgi:hypothetical protein|nr:hypothetical protein [Edaphobacter sp.]